MDLKNGNAFGIRSIPIICLAQVFGVTACILILISSIHYEGGLAFHSKKKIKIYNVHPVFMFVGFIFFSSQAILSYKMVPAKKKGPESSASGASGQRYHTGSHWNICGLQISSRDPHSKHVQLAFMAGYERLLFVRYPVDFGTVSIRVPWRVKANERGGLSMARFLGGFPLCNGDWNCRVRNPGKPHVPAVDGPGPLQLTLHACQLYWTCYSHFCNVGYSLHHSTMKPYR